MEKSNRHLRTSTGTSLGPTAFPFFILFISSLLIVALSTFSLLSTFFTSLLITLFLANLFLWILSCASSFYHQASMSSSISPVQTANTFSCTFTVIYRLFSIMSQLIPELCATFILLRLLLLPSLPYSS